MGLYINLSAITEFEVNCEMADKLFTMTNDQINKLRTTIAQTNGFRCSPKYTEDQKPAKQSKDRHITFSQIQMFVKCKYYLPKTEIESMPLR